MNVKRVDSHWEEEEASDGKLKKLLCVFYFLLRRALLELLCLYFFLTPTWAGFGACLSGLWVEGDAQGKFKSGEECWHGGSSGGPKMKSLSPSLSGMLLLLLLNVDWDLCVCVWGRWMYREFTCKPCQKWPRTKMSPGWVLPRWKKCVCLHFPQFPQSLMCYLRLYLFILCAHFIRDSRLNLINYLNSVTRRHPFLKAKGYL